MKNTETTRPRELKVKTGSFDYVNSFGVQINRWIKTCTLFYAEDECKFCGIPRVDALCASWSDRELAESKRIREEAPLEHGDIVMIEGDLYKVRLNIVHSNSFDVYFDKI